MERPIRRNFGHARALARMLARYTPRFTRNPFPSGLIERLEFNRNDGLAFHAYCGSDAELHARGEHKDHGRRRGSTYYGCLACHHRVRLPRDRISPVTLIPFTELCSRLAKT
jgi:hypothetical protein